MSYWVIGPINSPLYLYSADDKSTDSLGPFTHTYESGKFYFKNTDGYFNGTEVVEDKVGLEVIQGEFSLNDNILYSGVKYSISDKNYFLVPTRYYRTSDCKEMKDGKTNEDNWRNGTSFTTGVTEPSWCENTPNYCVNENSTTRCGPTCFGKCEVGSCEFREGRWRCQNPENSLNDEMVVAIFVTSFCVFIFALIFSFMR
jgi:hypothetical protein